MDDRYKKRGLKFNNTLDSRVLRAVHNQQRQREQRDNAVNLRRRMENLESSPQVTKPKEIKSAVDKEAERYQKGLERYQKLMKWKEMKKKRMEREKKKRMPAFKTGVYHPSPPKFLVSSDQQDPEARTPLASMKKKAFTPGASLRKIPVFHLGCTPATSLLRVPQFHTGVTPAVSSKKQLPVVKKHQEQEVQRVSNRTRAALKNGKKAGGKSLALRGRATRSRKFDDQDDLGIKPLPPTPPVTVAPRKMEIPALSSQTVPSFAPANFAFNFEVQDRKNLSTEENSGGILEAECKKSPQKEAFGSDISETSTDQMQPVPEDLSGEVHSDLLHDKSSAPESNVEQGIDGDLNEEIDEDLAEKTDEVVSEETDEDLSEKMNEDFSEKTDEELIHDISEKLNNTSAALDELDKKRDEMFREKIDEDHNEKIDEDHSEEVDEDHSEKIDEDHSEEIDKDQNEKIDEDHSEEIDEDHNEKIDEDHSEEIDEDHSEKIDENHSEKMDEDHSEKIDEDHNEKIDEDQDTNEPKKRCDLLQSEDETLNPNYITRVSLEVQDENDSKPRRSRTATPSKPLTRRSVACCFDGTVTPVLSRLRPRTPCSRSTRRSLSAHCDMPHEVFTPRRRSTKKTPRRSSSRKSRGQDFSEAQSVIPVPLSLDEENVAHDTTANESLSQVHPVSSAPLGLISLAEKDSTSPLLTPENSFRREQGMWTVETSPWINSQRSKKKKSKTSDLQGMFDDIPTDGSPLPHPVTNLQDDPVSTNLLSLLQPSTSENIDSPDVNVWDEESPATSALGDRRDRRISRRRQSCQKMDQSSTEMETDYAKELVPSSENNTIASEHPSFPVVTLSPCQNGKNAEKKKSRKSVMFAIAEEETSKTATYKLPGTPVRRSSRVSMGLFAKVDPGIDGPVIPDQDLIAFDSPMSEKKTSCTSRRKSCRVSLLPGMTLSPAPEEIASIPVDLMTWESPLVTNRASGHGASSLATPRRRSRRLSKSM